MMMILMTSQAKVLFDISFYRKKHLVSNNTVMWILNIIMLLCPPLDAIENMISKTLTASYKKLGLFPRNAPAGELLFSKFTGLTFVQGFQNTFLQNTFR